VTLNFVSGWNKVEIVWYQGTYGHGFVFSDKFSLIDNCIMSVDENVPSYSILTEDIFSEYNNLNIFSFRFYSSITQSISIWQDSIETNSGETYILSCYARSSVNATITFMASVEGEDNKQSFDIISDNDWVLLELPFTASDNTYVSFEISGQEDGYVYIGALRLILEAEKDSSVSYIDGNKIITGTVVADKIAAGSITADKIKADTITADKIMDNQIFMPLMHFDSINTVFDPQTIEIADGSDYAHYVIMFDGYNPSSSYTPATSATVIIPADDGVSSATINAPAVCFNLTDNIYIDEYPTISVTVSSAKVSATDYVWASSSNKKSASTNCNVNGTYTYTFSSPQHHAIKRIEFVFTGKASGGTGGQVADRYYKTTSLSYTGDFSFPTNSKSSSNSSGDISYSTNVYLCPWASVSLGFKCYVYDDYNTKYTIASKSATNLYHNTSSAVIPPLIGNATRYYSLSASYAYTVNSTITVKKSDGTSKTISGDFKPPSTNLKSSITGPVTRTITTLNGDITIGKPYTVSGSDVTYYDDNKLIYPRHIYGIR
jgi:hypothetical protein